jgi:hypothetical protein
MGDVTHQLEVAFLVPNPTVKVTFIFEGNLQSSVIIIMKIFSTLSFLICLMCITSVKGTPFDNFINGIGKAFESVGDVIAQGTGIKTVANGIVDLFSGRNVGDVIKNGINQFANESFTGQIIHAITNQPSKILSAEQVSEAVPMEEAAPYPTPDVLDNLYVLIGKASFTIAQWVAIYWLFSRFIAKKSSTSLAHEYTPIVDQEA